MGQKIYFWILLLIFVSLGILIQFQDADASQAAEIEPGIIELSTTTEAGFKITDVAEKYTPKSKAKWVYFCLYEVTSHLKNKSDKQKCFYGSRDDFKNVKKGLVLNGIQYGLKNRIYNAKGNIPLQKNAYFYPVFVLRPQI
jgi:hypothetical protein